MIIRLVFIFTVAVLGTILSACSGKDASYSSLENENGSANASIPQAFDTRPALPSECLSGGFVFSIYSDANLDGVFNEDEQIVTSHKVCNGANGNNGSNGNDGQDGEDGQDAQVPAYATVDMIQACGNNVAYKEVLLRLQNGMVLASFSNNTSGDMTRLTVISDGTYMNTDGSSCQFTLSTAGSIRSISWGGQLQMSWPISY